MLSLFFNVFLFFFSSLIGAVGVNKSIDDATSDSKLGSDKNLNNDDSIVE